MEETSGFTNLSYGQNTRFLNQAINKLRECGSEAILGEMPKIAVIGNQSAGKSSLIEAMSGIRVPRQVGTCTRCPMEVVLSYSNGDAWSCQISLRIMYDAKGVLLSESRVIPFGEVLHNSEDVENRILLAQAAVLQLPFKEKFSVDEFLQDDYKAPPKPPVDFSRNVVRLEVCGPDLVDVTFIDLPGIISNANQKWVDTVTKLVSDYIAQPDCLILVAISMSDDIENQGAAQLARLYDRAGKRTIGVLTKADTVRRPEVFKRWHSIIMGEDSDHRLAHGYYLTMQERPEPDSTWIQNLKNESDFFQTSPFWTKLDESAKKCTGTLELRKKLSLELSRLIKTRIPALISEVNRCTREVKEKYRALPRPVIDAPHFYLHQLCQDFLDSLTESIKGDNDQKDLVLMIKEADRRFLTSLKSSIAHFGLADHDEKRQGILTKSANEFLMETRVSAPAARITRPRTPSPAFDSDGDVVDVTPSISRSTKTPRSVQRTPTKPRTRPEPPQTPPEDLPPPIQYTGIPFWFNLMVGEYIEFEELRRTISREMARKVAGALPYAVQERLIQRSMALWDRCAMEYFDDVSEAVQRILKKLCTQYFSRFERSGLFGEVWQLVNEVVIKLSTSTANAVTEQLEMEARPFTQNEESLVSTTKQLLKSITEYRRSESQNSVNALTSPNEYCQELHLIAQVLGYVKVAYTRFGDNIPMLVEGKFQYGLVPTIRRDLWSKFLTGEGHEERCKGYLEDAPELIAKRQDLMRKLKILRMAGEEVNKFQMLG